MLVQEEYLEIQNPNTDNERRFGCGSSDLYEPYTTNIKQLFLSLSREYGRCISKVYIDTDNGPRPIGWVFQKRMKYTDCNDTYLQETWVTLHDDNPTKTVEYHYHSL